MENNVNQTLIGVKPVIAKETKKCSCCGKVLPIEDFETYGKGRRSICRNCRRNESGATERFKDFTSRELIDELISRGYKGELKKVIVESVKL